MYTQIGVNKADPEHILVRVDPQYFRPTEVGTGHNSVCVCIDRWVSYVYNNIRVCGTRFYYI